MRREGFFSVCLFSVGIFEWLGRGRDVDGQVLVGGRRCRGGGGSEDVEDEEEGDGLDCGVDAAEEKDYVWVFSVELLIWGVISYECCLDESAC
jgi:hypothetical protein